MASVTLEELKNRKKAQVVKLIETTDVTRRIAEAAEHSDSVVAQMLLTEREQPVRELRELEDGIWRYVEELPENEAIRMAELLRGGEAETREEAELAEQVSQFRRTLESLLALDEKLSLRLAGKDSVYNTFRK